jgi:DNA-binding response OmpR family regulator
MIVDDDQTSVMLLRTLLELDDFEVSVAGRGGDVMAIAEKVKPDIFLMDYHLSDMDGVEVLRSLRAHADFAKTPVVMASGLDVEDEVMKAGATTFMIKPYEPDKLPGLFNRLVAG